MSVARTLIKLREFQTQNANVLAYGNEVSTVTTVKGALDWLFAVLYPQSKDSVPTKADLPLSGNDLNDYRIVLDDGDGRAASYRWEKREGELEASWQKIHDMDWSSDAILASFMNQTQDLYVHKNGRQDTDADGNPITGLFEGQTIFGGSTSGNLTLNANAGDETGPQSGYVQFDGPTRPTTDGSFDLGTSTERFRDIFLNGALKDGTLSITLQGIQDAIDHALATGNPHDTSYDDLSNRLGTLTVDGDVSGNVDLSSSGDKTLTLSVANDSHTHEASETILGFDTEVYNYLKESLVDTPELSWAFDDSTEEITPSVSITTDAITDIDSPQASSILASNPAGDKWVPVTPNIELTGEVSGSASYDGGWSIETLIESCPLDKIDGIILDNKSFNSVAGNPTFIYAPAHGLLNGEKVHLYGGITGSHIITWVNPDTFSIQEETLAPETGYYIPQGAQLLFDPDLNKFKIAKEFEEIRLAELSGLNEDVLTQYVALGGRSGGQAVHGSTLPSGKLILDSTSDSTKGSIEVKSKVTPFSDATYFGSWSGTDLGSSSKRFNDLYLAGQARGLRIENVTSLPSASATETGRIVSLNGELFHNDGAQFISLKALGSSENLGTGQGVYAGVSGTKLQFKSLKAGTGIAITANANEITLESNGGSYVDTAVDAFTGNGSQVAFILSQVPLSKENTKVFVSGVYQSKSSYTISGNVLTFSEAPPTGAGIEVEIFKVVSSPIIGPDATTTTKGAIQLSGDLGGTASSPTVPGLATRAPLVSPTFTGTPSAPTATSGTNTTQIATTAFVQLALSTVSVTPPDATSSTKGIVQLAGDLGGTASSPTVPGLATRAPLVSPALTGTPTAPTATSGTNTTQIATTAFVQSALSGLGGASQITVFDTVILNASNSTSLTGVDLFTATKNFTLSMVEIQIFTKGSITSGTLTVDIKKSSTLGGTFTSVLSTQPSINFATATDYQKATGVISTASVSANDILRLDVTSLPAGLGRIKVLVYGA